MRFVTVLILAIAVCSVLPDVAVARSATGPYDSPSMYRGMPYGHFCPGRGRGPYGKRRVVKTADEAKLLVETYFSSIGKDVRIGRVEERRIFYFVEILGSDGTLIDRAIVDKRTGRIRSIY
jgi:hypothetical protein